MDNLVAKPIIDIKTSVSGIFSESAFNQLDIKEKFYCYHLAKVSWEGTKICYFQKSYESPAIFHLLQHAFNQPIDIFKNDCFSEGVTEDEWNRFLVWTSSFFQNAGNYKHFGDTKFIPDLSEDRFEKILFCSKDFKNEDLRPRLTHLWNRIKILVFCYEKPYNILGIIPDGCTGYYSNDITKEELVLVNEFMSVINLSTLNTRIGKVKDNEFIVLVASINCQDRKTHFYNTKTIHIVYGEFSPIMKRLSYHMEKALNYASNKTQKSMIEKYVRHFNTGDIEVHKDSQRDWVKDIGPVIESNFGFIETYGDPLGVRAEYEGWVAVVNKQQSKQTAEVVKNADMFLLKSPWPKEFEKDKFLKPDFTALEVVAFGCSGTPLGINIPNYDDIRQNDGFKNVYLANNLVKPKSIPYLNKDKADNLINWYLPTLFHKVIYHELLGHGCGKLLQENNQGELNFDPSTINPITGKPVSSWYKANETWTSVFGKWNNPMEECRADSVALYFSCFPEATEILQPEYKDSWQQLMEAAFTEFIYQGIASLEYYNLETGKFSQAHVNGRFVIFQVLIEAGNKFITVEKTKNDEGKDWIYIDIDTSQCITTGKNAIKEFLLKLNVYKATADYENGVKMFELYSTPSPFFLELREIIMANKRPRRLEVQGNIVLENGQPVYKVYPESFEGVIQSFKERFPLIDNELIQIWEEEGEFIRPPQN